MALDLVLALVAEGLVCKLETGLEVVRRDARDALLCHEQIETLEHGVGEVALGDLVKGLVGGIGAHAPAGEPAVGAAVVVLDGGGAEGVGGTLFREDQVEGLDAQLAALHAKHGGLCLPALREELVLAHAQPAARPHQGGGELLHRGGADRIDRLKRAHQRLSSGRADARNVIEHGVHLLLAAQGAVILDGKTVRLVLNACDEAERLTVPVDGQLCIVIV